MEYTNYKTNKHCSREEYIQNGLERGELLYRYDCGCVIIQDRTADAYIVYCPKHEAAPDLYEALQFFMHQLEPWTKLFPGLTQWTDLAREAGEKAIAKAESNGD